MRTERPHRLSDSAGTIDARKDIMAGLNIASVAFGVALFVVALALYARTWRLAGGQRGWWVTLVIFVVGFLLGYSLWLTALVTQQLLMATDLLVSQIFFWGSVFVLITARLFERTVKAQKLAETERLELERTVQHGHKLESLGILALLAPAPTGPNGKFPLGPSSGLSSTQSGAAPSVKPRKLVTSRPPASRTKP